MATKAITYALAAVEPLAVARLQGVKAKIYYTAYQGNIFGLAVPADSPIQKISDLKGKRIGVIAMGGGVLVAKALVANAGLNPEKDINIVVAGEGARPIVDAAVGVAPGNSPSRPTAAWTDAAATHEMLARSRQSLPRIDRRGLQHASLECNPKPQRRQTRI